MGKVDKIAKKVMEMHSQAENLHEDYKSKLSYIDKEISDIEHYIENHSYQKSLEKEMFKRLKNKFEKRRQVKNNFCKSQSLKDKLKGIKESLEDDEDFEYHYRTETIKQIAAN